MSPSSGTLQQSAPAPIRAHNISLLFVFLLLLPSRLVCRRRPARKVMPITEEVAKVRDGTHESFRQTVDALKEEQLVKLREIRKRRDELIECAEAM